MDPYRGGGCALVDGTRQLVKAPTVLVWDRLNTHVSHAIREVIAERAWLAVFLLPAYPRRSTVVSSSRSQ